MDLNAMQRMRVRQKTRALRSSFAFIRPPQYNCINTQLYCHPLKNRTY